MAIAHFMIEPPPLEDPAVNEIAVLHDVLDALGRVRHNVEARGDDPQDASTLDYLAKQLRAISSPELVVIAADICAEIESLRSPRAVSTPA
jgi:hypothetical protein